MSKKYDLSQNEHEPFVTDIILALDRGNPFCLAVNVFILLTGDLISLSDFYYKKQNHTY